MALPLLLGAASLGYGLSKAGGKKKNKGFDMIRPEPYTGARPFNADEVGFGASALKGIGDQYLSQLKSRAQGIGVGFDPERRLTLRSQFLEDFDDYEQDVRDKASAQASGQGLRGGIPLSIGAEYTKGLSRARTRGLSDIDLEDLEARREDQNQAIYAQPQAVAQGTGIQQNRANFDLAEWQASQPTYIEPQQNNILPALIGAAGTIGGAYFGGPAGAAAGGSIANAITSQKRKAPSIYQDESDIFNHPAVRRGRSNLY